MGAPEDIEDIFSGNAPSEGDSGGSDGTETANSGRVVSVGSHIANSTNLKIRGRSGRVAFTSSTFIDSGDVKISLGLQREGVDESTPVQF